MYVVDIELLVDKILSYYVFFIFMRKLKVNIKKFFYIFFLNKNIISV